MKMMVLACLLLATASRPVRADAELLLGQIDGQTAFELVFARPPEIHARGKNEHHGHYLDVASDLEYPLRAFTEPNGKIQITVHKDFTAYGGSGEAKLFLLNGTLARDGSLRGTWERLGSAERRSFRADHEPLLLGSREAKTVLRETKKRFPSSTPIKRSCNLALDEFPLQAGDPAAQRLNTLLERRFRTLWAPYLTRVTRCSSPGATFIAMTTGPTFLGEGLASIPFEWQFTVHRRPERLPPDDNPTDTPDYSWGPVTSEGSGVLTIDLRSGRELSLAGLLGSRPSANRLLAALRRRAARRRVQVKPAIASFGLYPRHAKAHLDPASEDYERQEFLLSQRQLRRLAAPSSPLGKALPPGPPGPL